MAFRLKHPEPLESQVLRAVRTALRYHPAVLEVWRINSGRAWLKGAGGRDRPVRFHDIPGCSDLVGILRGGRWLAVECKRPSTRKDTTDAQAAFLALVRASGGAAFVATSAEEALRELEAALA